MGYNTDFDGSFELNKPLSLLHAAYLNAFRRTKPGLWCQWVPNDSGTAIEWDGGEKFYYYVDWIEYLIKNFLEPWGYVLNGVVRWYGEDRDDLGEIIIKDNVVKIRTARLVWDD